MFTDAVSSVPSSCQQNSFVIKQCLGIWILYTIIGQSIMIIMLILKDTNLYSFNLIGAKKIMILSDKWDGFFCLIKLKLLCFFNIKNFNIINYF